MKYSVLIVDDEPVAREGYSSILNGSKLPISDIRVASNGVEALDLMKDRIAHIVITDIHMPVMNGLDFCRKIYKKCPHVVLIVVTGYADFQYAKRAITYGVKDYIVKPVKRKQLIDTMSEVILNLNSANELINLPFNQIEEIVNKLERSLIYNQSQLFNETINVLNSYYERLELSACIVLDHKIKDLLYDHLKLKTDYVLTKNTSTFTGIEKKDFYAWHKESFDSIANEIHNSKSRLENNLIYLAMDYIKNNYSTDITLESLAAQTGFSPAYFSRLFKKIVGKTFTEYRREIRIDKSKVLLCETKKSIKEITFDVGYNDVTNFIRSFKKCTGYTPKKYREMGINK